MTDEIMDEWKKHSITLGRIVKANIRGTEVTGLAEDITKDGRLMVKSDDGGQYEILSGEISVRGVSGYV